MRMMEDKEQIGFHDLWFGKTCQEVSQATTAKTSEASWKKLQGSQTRPFLFLDLTGGSGQARDPSSVTDSLCVGDCTTLDFGESRNGGEDSLFSPTSMAYLPLRSCLSAILEKNPDPKYNLSPKACQGILNRAYRRRKKLPEALKVALERQALLLSETTTTDESLPMNPSRSTLVGGNRQPNLFTKRRDSRRKWSGGDEHESPDLLLQRSPSHFSDKRKQSESGRPRADAELRCGEDDLRPRELSGSSVAMAFKLGNGEKSRSIGLEREVSPTLNSECGGNKPAVFIGDTDEQAKD